MVFVFACIIIIVVVIHVERSGYEDLGSSYLKVLVAWSPFDVAWGHFEVTWQKLWHENYDFNKMSPG